MSDRDRLKLLFGPYKPPPVKRGDQTECLYRDATVVVARLSDARIPWPRCYLAEGRARGFGLVIDEELARAIKHESAAAVAYWWGVSKSSVRHWRHAFGVGRTDAEGSQRLINKATRKASAARTWPVGVSRRHGLPWTTKEIALLGVLPDGVVATRIGRSRYAVRCKRRELGRPCPAIAPRR